MRVDVLRCEKRLMSMTWLSASPAACLARLAVLPLHELPLPRVCFAMKSPRFGLTVITATDTSPVLLPFYVSQLRSPR
jgi:hypothetical protein